MAFSAIRDPERLKERLDADEAVERKIDDLACLVRESSYLIFFTGAGISTAAGIPDFRGEKGIWTLEAQGKKPIQGLPTMSVFPTLAHLSIVELLRNGTAKYLVSQNCDGLHRRSGVPAAKISEYHGNVNIEVCSDCGESYYRDFRAVRIHGGPDHFTGRLCPKPDCEGKLLESTVDFGQCLPETPLRLGTEQSKMADLCIVLGSSCTVPPASLVPERVKNRGGKLVVVNLQRTPLYETADLNIFAPIDRVMAGLMDRLEMPIPVWSKVRRVNIRNEFDESTGRWKMELKGLRHDDPPGTSTPFTCIRKVQVSSDQGGSLWKSSRDPFVVSKDVVEEESFPEVAVVTISWFNHHEEIPARLRLPIKRTFDVEVFLRYDFCEKGWFLIEEGGRNEAYERLMREAEVESLFGELNGENESVSFSFDRRPRVTLKILKRLNRDYGKICEPVSPEDLTAFVETCGESCPYDETVHRTVVSLMTSWPARDRVPVLDLLTLLSTDSDWVAFYEENEPAFVEFVEMLLKTYRQASRSDAAKTVVGVLQVLANVLSTSSAPLAQKLPAFGLESSVEFLPQFSLSERFCTAHTGVILNLLKVLLAREDAPRDEDSQRFRAIQGIAEAGHTKTSRVYYPARENISYMKRLMYHRLKLL